MKRPFIATLRVRGEHERSTLVVDGDRIDWEAKSLTRLDRRPFRIVGWDEEGVDGRQFVARYFGLGLEALVAVSVKPTGLNKTSLSLIVDVVADNPFRARLRNAAGKVLRRATKRLLSET